MKFINNYKHNTDLHIAAKDFDTDEIQNLLNNGAIVDINTKNIDGNTPLLETLSQGFGKLKYSSHEEREKIYNTLKMLIDNGADVKHINNNSDTVLHMLVRYDNHSVESIKMLVAEGANLNAKNSSGNIPLIEFVHSCPDTFYLYYDLERESQSRLDTLKLFMNYGADVNEKYKDEVTLLHLFTQKNDDNIAKYLIEQGASIESTALFYAAGSRGSKVLELLLKNAESPNIQSNMYKLFDISLTSALKAVISNKDKLTLLHKYGAVPFNDSSIMDEIELACGELLSAYTPAPLSTMILVKEKNNMKIEIPTELLDLYISFCPELSGLDDPTLDLYAFFGLKETLHIFSQKDIVFLINIVRITSLDILLNHPDLENYFLTHPERVNLLERIASEALFEKISLDADDLFDDFKHITVEYIAQLREQELKEAIAEVHNTTRHITEIKNSEDTQIANDLSVRDKVIESIESSAALCTNTSSNVICSIIDINGNPISVEKLNSNSCNIQNESTINLLDEIPSDVSKLISKLNTLSGCERAKLVFASVLKEDEEFLSIIESVGYWKEFAAYIAVQQNSLQVLNYCINKGIDFDSFIGEGLTLASSILSMGDNNFINALFASGQSLQLTALSALTSGNFDQLTILCNHDTQILSKIQEIDACGLSAAGLVIAAGNLEALEFIKENEPECLSQEIHGYKNIFEMALVYNNSQMIASVSTCIDKEEVEATINSFLENNQVDMFERALENVKFSQEELYRLYKDAVSKVFFGIETLIIKNRPLSKRII